MYFRIYVFNYLISYNLTYFMSALTTETSRIYVFYLTLYDLFQDVFLDYRKVATFRFSVIVVNKESSYLQFSR